MKKLISVLLMISLLVSFVSISASAYSWNDPDAITVDEAVAEYEAETGEEVETFRYYFLMPNGSNGERSNDELSMYYDKYHASWYTRFEDGTPATNTAGIYWWDSDVADPDGWIGYLPSGVDENDPDIYYADVPQAATTIIWNNGVDGGMDPDDPIYYISAQTVNIPCEYYDAGESDNYPNGTENFDEMIFVITPGLVHTSDFSLKQTCDGEWYYYYGNGCYGFTENGDEDNCLRDDHFDASGNHIGKHTPSVDLTNCVIAGADETDPSKINGTVHGYMGDADGDGEVSVMDATEIQLYVARLKAMDEVSVLLSEVDRDGDTSVMDATEIQLFVARLKTSDVIGRILYTPVLPQPPAEEPTLFDGAEYNDTIPVGGTIRYKFTANESGNYVFISDVYGSLTEDPQCKLYDSDGNLLEPDWYVDDYNEEFYNYNFYLIHYFEKDKTYYFEISNKKPHDMVCPVFFHRDYSDIEDPTEEPDYPIEDPTEVAYEEEHGGTLYDGFNSSVYVDSYTRVVMTFTPSVSGEYTIESDTPYYSLYDPQCSLYDSYGTLLDFGDDENDLDFCLTYYLTEGRTYYYKIKNCGSSSMNCPIKFYLGEDDNLSYTQTGVINFDANTADWYNYRFVSCHIWEYDGDSFYAWGSKKQKCTDTDGDGIWTYDLEANDIYLESDKLYGVIFYNSNYSETYNLLMGTDCIGDTAYCDGTYYENPVDSIKTSQAAFWRNQYRTEYGPELCITSIGNIVGTCVPKYTSTYSMFVRFLVEYLENARVYSGKTDQQLLDDTAEALGLYVEDVEEAIKEAYVYVKWSAYKSTLDRGT